MLHIKVLELMSLMDLRRELAGTIARSAGVPEMEAGIYDALPWEEISEIVEGAYLSIYTEPELDIMIQLYSQHRDLLSRTCKVMESIMPSLLELLEGSLEDLL